MLEKDTVRHLLLFLTVAAPLLLSAQAEELPPLDSSLQIYYPYKTEEQEIFSAGMTAGITLSNLRVTSADGSQQRFCRFTSYGYISDLTLEQAAFLAEDLEQLWIIAKSDKPAVRTGYYRRIPDKLDYSLVYPGTRWVLYVDTDEYLNRGRLELQLSKVADLSTALTQCAENGLR